MRNLVLASFEDPQGNQCVDIFSRPDGTFGFEEFRRDWEDGGLWVSLNRYSRLIFRSEMDVRAQAEFSTPWIDLRCDK
jgi:hypothetical protein